MTTQEAYEGMRAWLGRVGASKAQASRTGLCMYRTGDGNKCAVGAIIPDDEYYEDLEEESVETVARLVPSLRNVNEEFLREAQFCHDSWVQHDDDEPFEVGVVRALDEKAHEFGLEVVSS